MRTHFVIKTSVQLYYGFARRKDTLASQLPKVESRIYNTKAVVKALMLGKLEPETTSQRTHHADHCALPDPTVLGFATPAHRNAFC
jgi:hypothetical protein